MSSDIISSSPSGTDTEITTSIGEQCDPSVFLARLSSCYNEPWRGHRSFVCFFMSYSFFSSPPQAQLLRGITLSAGLARRAYRSPLQPLAFKSRRCLSNRTRKALAVFRTLSRCNVVLRSNTTQSTKTHQLLFLLPFPTTLIRRLLSSVMSAHFAFFLLRIRPLPLPPHLTLHLNRSTTLQKGWWCDIGGARESSTPVRAEDGMATA